MAIPQTIKDLANKVRTAEYGKDVRESLAKSMEETGNLADETKTRQDSLETQFQTVLDETTGKDVVSAPEILAARGTHPNLKDRLDTEHTEVMSSLAQTTKGLSFVPAQNVEIENFGTDEPVFLDNIGDGYIYGSISRNLYRTTSTNDPWELVNAFPDMDAVNGVRPLGDGEILLLRSTDGLWKSSGWATNPLTATWRQVLVTNGRVTPFSVETNPDSGWITATTYINGDMTNARYVWLSKDNGNTFTEIFDMIDFEPDNNKAHSHLHFAIMDPYWNPIKPRIWISYHKTNEDPTESSDPMKRIKYSDDEGQTWVDFSNEGYQPVSGIATPEGMIFGSDESVVGVYIVRRTPNPADMKYELFYAIRENIGGIFGWAMKTIQGEGNVYHMAFRSSIAGVPGRVITTDGKHIEETLIIPPATSSDTVTISDIVEHNGKLLATCYTSAGVAYKVVADRPTRGLPVVQKVGSLQGGVAGALGTAAGVNARAEMLGSSFGANSKSDLRGTSIGEKTITGQEGTALGSEASATGNGTALGTRASTVNGVSVGRNSVAQGDGTALGTTTKAITESVALGSFAEANNAQSVAIGRLSKVNKDFGVAIGGLSESTGTGALALGRQAKALHDFSIALGYGMQTTFANQLKIGARHIEFDNSSTPSSKPTDGVRFFSRRNSSGKTELCALFPTGSPIVIATEA